MGEIIKLYNNKVGLAKRLEDANRAGAMDLAERIELKISLVLDKIDEANKKYINIKGEMCYES